MKARSVAIVLLAALSAGCQPPQADILLTPAQTGRLSLSFADAVTSDSQGNVFLLARRNVMRYDPAQRQVARLLRSSRSDLVDLATADGDVVLALSTDRLYATFGGEPVPVLTLPGRGLRVTCAGDACYLLLRTPDGETGLLRYDLATKELWPLLRTRQKIADICAVPGGCLIASGGSLHKLLVPPGTGGNGDVEQVLLLAVAKDTITSVAADPDAKYVYFSTPKTVYAWAERHVVPLWPAGGRLSYARGALTIASPRPRQVVRLVSPAARTRELLRDAPPAVLTPKE